MKVAENNNIGVARFRSPGGSDNSTMRSLDIDDEDLRIFKLNQGSEKYNKLKDLMSKHDDIVFHESGSGVDSLAHEIGHVVNANSLNPIKRNLGSLNSKYSSVCYNHENGLVNSTKNQLKRLAVIADEKNASNSAIKLLKNSGASDDMILNSRNNLNKSLDTYTIPDRIERKRTIRDNIQIPSRRSLNIGDPGYGSNKPGSNRRNGRMGGFN